MANILIIDDDVAVRDYLSTLVSRLQHQPLVAATCAQGLAQLANPAVNVVIADIYLPDSPPLKQWIKQLRDAAAGRPLILITGEPSEELTALAQRGEVLAFLTKPFELAFIKSLLSRALANPPSA
ncbi:MAG TPA: response regulator [Kiritimatiellia bacterium]|jgi:two-component system response regulator PilR (NtrC family)|nr:response regulator [Kiritimatiellia bacterium]HOE37934.1 response regulator [Kiritimatiellia bacterium]HPY62527.1 response regulator [Kiritimatiellia bacterium]HQF20911.1 response regulator [Kiritimatiellia bacterium]HQG75339.1 response regulator [Kiritimatiellia bacterium]